MQIQAITLMPWCRQRLKKRQSQFDYDEWASALSLQPG